MVGPATEPGKPRSRGRISILPSQGGLITRPYEGWGMCNWMDNKKKPAELSGQPVGHISLKQLEFEIGRGCFHFAGHHFELLHRRRDLLNLLVNFHGGGGNLF